MNARPRVSLGRLDLLAAATVAAVIAGGLVRSPSRSRSRGSRSRRASCSSRSTGCHRTDALASVVWVLGVAPFVRAAWLRLAVARVPFLQRRIRLGPGS